MRPQPPTWIFADHDFHITHQIPQTPASDASLRQLYITAVAVHVRRVVPAQYLPDTFQELYNHIDAQVTQTPHVANRLVLISMMAHGVPSIGGHIPEWMTIEMGIPIDPAYYRDLNAQDRQPAPPKGDYTDHDLDALD